jgi:dihydrodipicolinate synthase/N-acetylneuraminate lyase
MKPLGGVLAVFQTPFTDDGSIDEAALERELDWLFANGADGVVLGMVSEVLRLSSEERDRLASLACKLAQGRGISVISVGAESTKVSVRHALHAESSGADAIMATAPMLHPASDEQLLRHFVAISSSVEIPLVVQDASGYVGAPLTVQLEVRLHDELGDRVFFKPEAPPIGTHLTNLLAATAGSARVFEGTGGLYLVDSFRRGVVGTMPAGDLVWAVAALWRALSAGDLTRAYRIAGPLALIVSLQHSLDSFVTIEKHLLVRQGVLSSGTLRGPLDEAIDQPTLEEIDRLVDLLRQAVGR